MVFVPAQKEKRQQSRFLFVEQPAFIMIYENTLHASKKNISPFIQTYMKV